MMPSRAPFTRCELIVVGQRPRMGGPERYQRADLLGGAAWRVQGRERASERNSGVVGGIGPCQPLEALEASEVPMRAELTIESADLLAVDAKLELWTAQQRDQRIAGEFGQRRVEDQVERGGGWFGRQRQGIEDLIR